MPELLAVVSSLLSSPLLARLLRPRPGPLLGWVILALVSGVGELPTPPSPFLYPAMSAVALRRLISCPRWWGRVAGSALAGRVVPGSKAALTCCTTASPGSAA